MLENLSRYKLGTHNKGTKLRGKRGLGKFIDIRSVLFIDKVFSHSYFKCRDVLSDRLLNSSTSRYLDRPNMVETN